MLLIGVGWKTNNYYNNYKYYYYYYYILIIGMYIHWCNLRGAWVYLGPSVLNLASPNFSC